MPKHDVFVSYSHDDAADVVTLVKSLRDEGIDVVTDESFQPGRGIELMIREAVNDCRHVALFLTPQWMESRWTSYEAALGRELDPQGELGVVIPLMYRECVLPPRLLEILHVDISDEKKRPTELQRVIKVIKESRSSKLALPLRPQERPVASEAAVTALRRLEAIADTKGIHDALFEFRDYIGEASRQILLLADLKDVHEQLHQLQLQFQAVTTLQVTGVADLRPFAKLYATAIENTLPELEAIARRTSFTSGDLPWIAQFGDLSDPLKEAIALKDNEEMKGLIYTADHLVSTHSQSVNTQLTTAARLLRLPDLIDAMDAICNRAEALQLDAVDLGLLAGGLQALKRLARNLSALIVDHDGWQNAEASLRVVDSTLHDRITNLRLMYPRLVREIEVLDRTGPTTTFEKAREELEAAIDVRNREAAWEPYQTFRRYTVSRFYNVDRSLKRQCDELRFVGAPLTALSEKLA